MGSEQDSLFMVDRRNLEVYVHVRCPFTVSTRLLRSLEMANERKLQ